MAWYIVLRSSLMAGAFRKRGQAVETTGWVHTERLVTQRILRPATDEELRTHPDIVHNEVVRAETRRENEERAMGSAVAVAEAPSVVRTALSYVPEEALSEEEDDAVALDRIASLMGKATGKVDTKTKK